MRLAGDHGKPWENRDLEVGYAVWHQVITAACHVLPPGRAPPGVERSKDPRGTFCVNVSPPAPECTAVSS